MEDVSLYSRLLGISAPWYVEDVVFDETELSVVVRVGLCDGTPLLCPACGKECAGYDQREQRRWRHLDSCGYKTLLEARMPRLECDEHGIRTVATPWSEPGSRFTRDFERFAIDALMATKSQVRVARLLRLLPHQVNTIMGKAVRRGMLRRLPETVRGLSLDEKSFRKYRKFVTVLTDTHGRRVLDLGLDRTGDSTVELMKGALTPEQIHGVEVVTMDMWDGYIKAARELLPRAGIVFDRFHIALYLNEAVDDTRIAENKRLAKAGDTRLVGSKFFWVKNPDKIKASQFERYGDLRQADLETARAWRLKETFRGFFEQPTPEDGKTFFERWAADVAESGNRFMAKVAKMLRRYYYGLANYLVHRTSNSAAEGTNSLIQEIKFAARGFRTFKGFRIAVLFFLGKLDLYPHKTS